MINSSSFQDIQVQAFAFTSESTRISASVVLGTILTEFASLYDGPPHVIPLHPDAPPEIPRVVLTSNDGYRKLEASINRIVSTYKIKTGESSSRSNIFAEAISPIIHFSEKSNYNIKSVACVIERVSNQEADVAKKISTKFCSKWALDSAIRRSDSFEIHNHKVFEPSKIKYPYQGELNSWFRCRTINRDGLGSNCDAVMVLQDLNTLNITHSLDLSELKSFFNSAEGIFAEIFHLYFPLENSK